MQLRAMKYHVYHKIPLNTIQYDDDDDHNDVFVERELAANDTTLFSIQPKENLSLYYYFSYEERLGFNNHPNSNEDNDEKNNDNNDKENENNKDNNNTRKDSLLAD